MIERLTGKILDVNSKNLVIEVNGVGYCVSIANNSSFILDKTTTIFIHTIFSQDRGLVLYGFDSVLKRELFCNLINCHKIGPQTALGILANVVTPELCRKFIDCIVKGRDDLLVQYFKIGAKTAAAVVSELKDKILKISLPSDAGSQVAQASTDLDFSEVIQALRAMGYKDVEIMPAIKTVYSQKDQSGLEDFTLALKRVLMVISRAGK